LVDPFTPEQTLWEFENIFVRSGQTNGQWNELRAVFDALRQVDPGESAARAILDRAREFGAFCAGFKADPIRFKAAPAAQAAAD
jgi:hypothetical protein